MVFGLLAFAFECAGAGFEMYAAIYISPLTNIYLCIAFSSY